MTLTEYYRLQARVRLAARLAEAARLRAEAEEAAKAEAYRVYAEGFAQGSDDARR